MKVRNKFDNSDYFVSVIRVRKRIAISMASDGIPFLPIRLENIRLQGAVYLRKANFLRQLFAKPVLVVNLDDALGQISQKEFEKFMEAVVGDERMKDLLDETKSYEVFTKYGFVSVRKDIWSLLSLSKIKNAFIFRDA